MARHLPVPACCATLRTLAQANRVIAANQVGLLKALFKQQTGSLLLRHTGIQFAAIHRLPVVPIGAQCNKPHECQFKEFCQKQVEAELSTKTKGGEAIVPLTLLPDRAGKELAARLADKGYTSLLNVVPSDLVVTNAKFCGLLSAWAAKEKAFPVRVINDGTKTPEERLGAMGDIAFVLKEIGMNSDLVVVGSDNLFDADLAPFFAAATARKTSPTVGLYDISDVGMATKYGVVGLNAQDKIISLE